MNHDWIQEAAPTSDANKESKCKLPGTKGKTMTVDAKNETLPPMPSTGSDAPHTRGVEPVPTISKEE